MELQNHTPFAAALFRGCIDDRMIAASLVARRTFELVDAKLVRAAKEVWPVSAGPWESPAGPMAGDDLFYRGGVDLFVFGSARAAGGRPVPSMEVKVEAGREFKRSVAVFGDRVWTRSGDRVVPGAPNLFTEMPLILANAYGGQDLWDELPIPFQANPIGKGYALTAESAIGKPLPNIEDPAALIRCFGDHPEPAGVSAPPYPYPLRAAKTVTFDPLNGLMTRLDPKFFNTAFPEMVAPPLSIGDEIRVTGVTADQPIRFKIPAPEMVVRVQFGDRYRTETLPVDQIGVEVDLARVFVTYRAAFRYNMVALEKRSCELLPATSSEGAATPTGERK
jgi:hypothetical protein